MKIAAPRASVNYAGIAEAARAMTRYLRGFRTGAGVRDLGLLIAVLAGITGIVFAIDPHLDLQVTSLFFDDATRSFPAASDPIAVWLRGKSMWIFTAFSVCVAAAVIARLVLPMRVFPVPARSVVFLALTLVLGPGLLVNGVLKEHWARPRPGAVVEFGGTLPFMPWWDPRGGCSENCSFVSGETSGATWSVAPALLVPGAVRVVALSAAGIFTVVIASLRVAFGGHFTSDVIFAALLTLAVIWAIYGLVFRVDWTRAQTAPLPPIMRRAVARFGRTEPKLIAYCDWTTALRFGDSSTRPRL
jgi:lipid A 4'-phosphatase